MKNITVKILIAVITFMIGTTVTWIYQVIQVDETKIAFNKGQKDARADANNGTLKIKSSEFGPQQNIYGTILHKDYGIELEKDPIRITSIDQAEYIEGYNNVMVSAIEERFGKNTLNACWSKAGQEIEDNEKR